MDSIRSPFFYVGDKYKLMPQLKELFPTKISNYVEPFVGGGSSFLNINAKKYYLNDSNEWIIKLHKFFNENKNDFDAFINHLYNLIEYYNLSCSFKNDIIPDKLKSKYPKTYYAKYNKLYYNELRLDFNNDKQDMSKLYLLLIYGFNHMIRFNNEGDFNLPVGNVDFNKNVYKAIKDYLSFCNGKTIKYCNMDYIEFISKTKLKTENTFIYFDPPYLISSSEYNKYWTEKDEINLYRCIDLLNDKGFKFGLTNLIKHKGMKNDILLNWCAKYKVFDIDSNYISFNDNTIKENSKEVFVTNYGKEE